MAIAIGIIAVVASGCSRSEASLANDDEASPPARLTVPAATTSPTGLPADAGSVEKRAEDIMWALFLPPTSGGDFFDAVNVAAVRSAGELGNPALAPPLIEVARFAFTSESTAAVAESLRKLTGADLGSDFEPWYTWLGKHPETPVLDDYARWKGLMLAQIDSRFSQFFYRDVPARVPLWGAVWGGVKVDGIPPLDDPVFVSAGEATYLLDDDVVIGVEVNGDVRAYPHRILAWHEMSNGVVGGQPVVLVY